MQTSIMSTWFVECRGAETDDVFSIKGHAPHVPIVTTFPGGEQAGIPSEAGRARRSAQRPIERQVAAGEISEAGSSSKVVALRRVSQLEAAGSASID